MDGKSEGSDSCTGSKLFQLLSDSSKYYNNSKPTPNSPPNVGDNKNIVGCLYKMALDGKTIIKEEITDKDAYEATSSATRRNKATSNSSSSSSKDSNTTTSNSNNSNNAANIGGVSTTNTRSCRTPDSPESARAVAPHSPMSPQLHQHQHTSLAPPPRPNRNASASPVINGATTTPPPQPTAQSAQAAVAAAAAAAAHVEQARLLGKIRKFLGSLVQLAQDVHPDVSERVRALVLSLGSGSISIDEFRMALQEAINLPLRPYVVPLLKTHISLLQREIVALSRASNQTTLQYVTNHENSVMEFSSNGPPAEYSDIFVQIDSQANGNTATSLVFKRRSSDTLMEPHGHNGAQEWNDYMAAYPPAKRLHAHNPHVTSQTADSRMPFASAQPTIFDYSTSGANSAQTESSFSNLMEKANHRDDRDLRSSVNTEPSSHRPLARSVMPTSSSGPGGGGPGGSVGGQGEEEWKNIHTMLNCISAMVDKTKRAITILQQRGVEPQQPNYGEISPATLMEIRRQTEEKVAEFKRNAEDAVNQVKRQAVIEIQRAVVAAETRAAEVMAQERLRMEKFFVEMSRHSGSEREIDNKSPSIAASQNACWNCGRKATETCSGCNLARYCGAFCQHKDWEHHHQICGTTRTTDLSAKHASQVIPLTANIRGSLTRSPPTPSQPPAQSQATTTSANASQPSSLVANGIGSK